MESRSALFLRLAGLATASGLVFASYWCLRLAWADYLFEKDTPASIREASRLVPANADYKAATPSGLRGALDLNPRLQPAWIRLGLRAELERDYAAAESMLLEAAKVDNGYEPRWTLANYYFRRGDWEKFWPWARRALEMAYLDRTPLFRLCWQAPGGPQVILSRAIPDDARSEAHYLNFLLATGRLEAAAPVARRLETRDDDVRLPVLLAYCDRLVQANDAAGAVRVWNGLSKAGLIPHRRLDPSRGDSLTNEDFSHSPLEQGFDWKFLAVPGVSLSRSPSSVRMTFSGRQPERCRLLEQNLPLEAGRRYRLHFAYRTERASPESGLHWSVKAAGKELETGNGSLSGDDWTEGQLFFRMPDGAGLALLSLAYERASGTTRLEGSLFLRRLRLDFAD